MKKWLLIGALAFAGGVLAFAVHPSDSSVGPFDLKAVGGVLLATAALVAAGIGVVAGVKVCSKPGDSSSDSKGGGALQLDGESLRTITGLVAVVVAIVAVAALTVVAINLLGGKSHKESTVAITTSAFGIVSAVVSAYLGIKASANASNKALSVALGEQESDRDKKRKEAEEKEKAEKEQAKKDKPHAPPPHGGST